MRDDEEFRHQCEVRQMLIWRQQRGAEWTKEWIESTAKPRGRAAADRLLGDAARQWKLGNRGKADDWR